MSSVVSSADVRDVPGPHAQRQQHNETLSEDNNDMDTTAVGDVPPLNMSDGFSDYEDDGSGSSQSSEDSCIDELPEEMSSWRDSFFDVTRRATDMVVNYRFPLLFALITAAGPRTVQLIDRVAWSDVFRKTGSRRPPTADGSRGGHAYAPPPAWMRHSLAAIPRSLESTISAVLNAFGIPTLSQLQLDQLNKELDALSSSSNAVETARSVTPPPPYAATPETDNVVSDGVPFSLLIPVASAVILLGAKLLVAHHARRLPSHDVSEDEESAPIVEDSRSQLSDRADGGATEPMATERCSGRDDALDQSPKLVVPKLDVQGRRVNDGSQERNTSRSVASSEPTHGTRTTDPNRLTPRTSMLRSNSEAITGSIQRQRLGCAQLSATRQRIPELNERSVDTPPRIHTLETSQCSPVKPVMSMPVVVLALTTPATQVEMNAVVTAAQKYGVRTIIACKARRDAASAANQPQLGSLVVKEVDDVVAHCKQVCSEQQLVAVALVPGRPSDATSTPLHVFQYPMSDGTLFCVDPQDVGDFNMLQGEIAASSVAQASHPLPESLRWCHRCVHLDNESNAQRGIAGIVNVCLLDRSVKLRRALDGDDDGAQ